MDVRTFLIAVLAGQLIILGLDVRQRLLEPRNSGGTNRFRPRTLLFLAATVLFYGGLHYGGLTLAPDARELLASAKAFVESAVKQQGESRAPGTPAIVLIAVAGFYFGGLCDYVFHRFVSHSRPMWFTHEYHHLPTEVAAYMPGICVRPFAVVSVLPTMAASIFAMQLAIGVSGYRAWDMMPMLYVLVLIQTAIGCASHSSCLRRYGWLHRALSCLGLTTPQEHWLHHTADLDGNYGNFVTLWDRVFGTYLDPEKVQPQQHRAGLAYDQDFLGAVTFGKVKLPDSMRGFFELEKFCYLKPAETQTRSSAVPNRSALRPHTEAYYS